MRTTRTRLRESIAIIAGGTMTVIGIADLVDSLGPIDAEGMRSNARRHRIAPADRPHALAGG